MDTPRSHPRALVALALGTMLALPGCCDMACDQIYQDCLDNGEVDVATCDADHTACLDACDDAGYAWCESD